MATTWRLVRPCTRSSANSAFQAAAGAAGEALLAVGKELPWIGPIAFLIGGVVQAASDAKVSGGLDTLRPC
jgi:hypothetical protein